MSFRRASGVALLVVALATAGCGSGSSGSASGGGGETTGALTKAELSERADAICEEAYAEIEAIEAKNPGAIIPTVDLYIGMVNSLKSLGNPQETEGKYGEYLRTLGELKTIDGELKHAIKRGSADLEVTEGVAESKLSEFELYANDYGLKKCWEGPNAPGRRSGF